MIETQEGLKSGNVLVFKAMNTDFYVEISNSTIVNWKEQLLEWFDYVDREWSRFNHDNELARLNGAKMGQTVMLAPPLFDVLQKAEYYRQRTAGRFSPYLLNLLQFHGYDQTFPFVIAKAAPQNKQELVQNCPFIYDPEQNSATRIGEGQVELGGLGKGYAVEAAMVWLKNHAQAQSGIVDGGGDISVWSTGPKVWKIGIVDPYNPNRELRQITMKNGSIATSNIIYRSWQQGSEKKHHILNGKTGLPVKTDIIQATVITENCLDAEVAAKLCFMEKDKKLEENIRKFVQNFKCVLVNEQGRILIS